MSSGMQVSGHPFISAQEMLNSSFLPRLTPEYFNQKRFKVGLFRHGAQYQFEGTADIVRPSFFR